jgi:hypothetical protein
MGVRVARIDHEPVGPARTGRGYGLTGTGPRIDAVADAYEAQLDLILGVASTEIRLRRLADEIGKTTRRVNALESSVIPDASANGNRSNQCSRGGNARIASASSESGSTRRQDRANGPLMNESPLITIREAERAAAELVENAHRLAEREVLTAKTRVAFPLAKAEENGRHLANRHHKEELENARAPTPSRSRRTAKLGRRPLPTRQRPICRRQSRTHRTDATGPQPQGGMIAMLEPMAKVESLDLAWRLLSAFPRANLKRIHPEIIDGFRGSLKEQDRFSDLNAKVRALS